MLHGFLLLALALIVTELIILGLKYSVEEITKDIEKIYEKEEHKKL